MRTSVAEETGVERAADATLRATPQRTEARAWPAGAGLGLVLVLAAALRFLRLGGQSLWVDEILSIARARSILTDGLDVQLLNGHGPVFFYLLAPFLALDPSEFFLRLPSALAGVGLVLVVYLLGKELDDRRAGLVAATLTAVSPFALWYSQEARYVNLFMLLAATSLLFMRRIERGGGFRDLLLYAVSTLLMLLSFVGGVFLLLAQNLWILFFSKARAVTLRRWFVAQGLVALVFVPWLIRAYEINLDVNPFVDSGTADFSVAEIRTGYPRSTQPIQIGYVLLVFGVGYSFGPSTQDLHHNPSLQPVMARAAQVAAGVALIGLVGLAGLVRSIRRSWRDTILLILCVVCPILGAYVLASISQIAFNVRYTSAAFPAFVLLLSSGLLWWKDRLPLGGLVLAGVVAVFGVALFNYYANPEYSKEDSRGAARLLERLRRPDERLVVGTSAIALEHYYRQPFERWNQVELLADRPSEAPGAGPPARIWLAATRTWQNPEFQTFLDRMGSCYLVERRYELPGYELLAYRVGSPQRPVSCTLVKTSGGRSRGGP
jgi:4-amino-4-deoxy-L-arabinose transferase-like glycosyltransferase